MLETIHKPKFQLRLFMTLAVIALALLGLTFVAHGQSNPNAAKPDDIKLIRMIGCNAAATAPIPDTSNLFIGRQLFNSDGTVLTRQDKCNSPNALDAIHHNRWGLVLEKLDWTQKQFSVVKPLLATPMTIPGGPLQGDILKAAYDPKIVAYHGQDWISFECEVLGTPQQGIYGTSSCIAPYDPQSQTIRKDKITVAVSGEYVDQHKAFIAAAVPSLLVYNDHLYIYWSCLTVGPAPGKFTRCSIRGAELIPDNQGLFWIKGANRLAYSADPVRTTNVWAPTPGDPMSDSAVDIKSIWTHGNDIIALAGLGGSGCVDPGVNTPGCFRMAIKKVNTPLGDRIFNAAPSLLANQVPTNPQGYTRPVKTPDGTYDLLGFYFYPYTNGYSERRIMPPQQDWPSPVKPLNGELVAYPFTARYLWPSP